MNLLWLKLILTPSLIGAASLAGRRWGHAISGWLVALPLTTAPIVFLLALTHGPAFAADASAGILVGCFSLAAFVLTYARTAPRVSWPLALAVGTLAFGLLTALLQSVILPPALTWIAVLAAFSLVLWLMPRYRASGTETAALPAQWDIPLRMLIATVFVLIITGVAPLLGARLAGLLTPFPLFTATMTAFAHAQHGPEAAIQVLRGLMVGIFSYATFVFALAMLLQPWGIPAAFGAAILVEIVLQGAALWLLRTVIE